MLDHWIQTRHTFTVNGVMISTLANDITTEESRMMPAANTLLQRSHEAATYLGREGAWRTDRP
eukprot:11471121-Prorocentrum_lima.AAC.1